MGRLGGCGGDGLDVEVDLDLVPRALAFDLAIRLEVYDGPGAVLAECEIHEALDEHSVRTLHQHRCLPTKPTLPGGTSRPPQERMLERRSNRRYGGWAYQIQKFKADDFTLPMRKIADQPAKKSDS